MLNCSICKTRCCGGSPVHPPLLMPFEVENFSGSIYQDEEDGFFRIKRGSNEMCSFLNSESKCSIYEHRPIECRLYPYILSYQNEELKLILHDGCPQKEKAPKPEIPQSVIDLPEDWWIKWERLST